MWLGFIIIFDIVTYAVSFAYQSDTVRCFDKSFKPKGWYDRDTNTTFDKNSGPTGTIYDFDRDE